MAALSCGCDYMFIPEIPPKENWETEFCALLEQGRKIGRRRNLVLVAESVKDQSGKPINSSYVREVLELKAGYEARFLTANVRHVREQQQIPECSTILSNAESSSCVVSLATF